MHYWACSSLQFDVSTGLFPPCRALICKVSTFLCVCVVWFVVVENLFLIRPALTELSLYCHIWALLGSGTFRVNLIQTLIVLKGWQTWFSFWLCLLCLSIAHSLYSPSVSLAPLLPFHHIVLCSSFLSQGLTQMKGWRDERGSHIAYNAYLLWGLHSSLTYVSLHMPPLKRDTWLPRAQQGNDKSSLLSLHQHPRCTEGKASLHEELYKTAWPL